jgi:hypothetical protein
LWRILEITVAGFNPTLPLEQPQWSRDMDILEFGHRHELYFRLQAKQNVYFSSRHRTGIFLRAMASSKYVDIVTNIQANIDAYRNPDNNTFLPQHFRLTNVTALIHNSAKARVQDIGHPRINRVSDWNSFYDMYDDNELALCHVQGYCPRVLAVGAIRDRGPMSRAFDRRGSTRRPGFDDDRCLAHPDTSGDRRPPTPRGQFARPDQRRCSFLPGVQCEACKRIGHKATNCDMLAMALFVDRYAKASLAESDRSDIETKWLARWKERLGLPARTPKQVMHAYCDTMNITSDMLDMAMDWDCWSEDDGAPDLA